MEKVSENCNPKNYTRQDRLNGWLALNRVSKSDLARKAGISPQYVSMVASGRRRHPSVINKLIDLGVPAELLPEPNGKKAEK